MLARKRFCGRGRRASTCSYWHGVPITLDRPHIDPMMGPAFEGKPMASSKTFRAGLIQLCASRSVEANIDAAAKLVREAKASGADYVQTPEMTNLMELGRKALFATIVEEERDPALAAFRELARELKLFFHIGSLAVKATPEKAANRGLLLDRDGEIVARYDKNH